VDGLRLRVINDGALAFAGVPVDVVFVGGGAATYLVDLEPGSAVEVPVA
jgi:hypothetical protein